MSSNSSAMLLLTKEEQGYVEIWNATFEFVKPMVIKAAIVLGIPDILYSKGPLTLEEIASETSAKNIDFLYRILRFLVAHGIFTQTDTVDVNNHDSPVRKYNLTEASKWLVSNREKTLVPYILLLFHELAQKPWQNLHNRVLEETNFFTQAGMTLYDYLAANPSMNDIFNKGMAARSVACLDTIVKHKDVFEGISSLVDVGGGIGIVTSKIVGAFPYIHGINFDRPQVIAKAPTFPGVTHVSGDMFVEIPSADALFIKMVLHGYDDETCKKILTNCSKALPDKGKLMVVDFLLNEGDPSGHACDMLMAASTPSGRDRTESEWINLLTSASFVRHKFHKMILDSMCIIEAFKS